MRIEIMKMQIKEIMDTFLKNARFFFKKHDQKILTGAGIAGVTTATVLAVKATPKAMKHIEEKKKELNSEKLSASETVKAAWKDYIPAGLAYAGGVACLIESPRRGGKKIAALTAAYAMAENALNSKNEAILEAVGKKGYEKIINKVDEKLLEETPASKSEIYVSGTGETLFFDSVSKRYFTSTYDNVFRDMPIRLNQMMSDQMSVSLNEYFMLLNIEGLGKIGEDLGWDVQDGFLKFEPGSKITDDNRTCFVIRVSREPRAV